MNKYIYCIHCYEEGNVKVLGFLDEETAYTRYKALCDALVNNANEKGLSFDEWDEVGGKEIACMSKDTLYRLCCHEVIDDDTELFAYTEYEDGKYYQLRAVDVSTYNECRRDLKGFMDECMSDDILELVDSSIHHAKFESDGCEFIAEAYVTNIEFE